MKDRLVLSLNLKVVLVVCALLNVSMHLLAWYDVDENENKNVPVALHYQEKPIIDDCIKALLAVEHWGYDDEMKEINLVDYYVEKEKSVVVEDELQEEDDDYYSFERHSFKWEYLGYLHNDLHVICGYEDWGGRDTGVTIGIINRVGDILQRVSTVMGDNYQVSLKNGAIKYSYPVADRTFIEMVADVYPEIRPLYDRSSKKGLYYGVSSHWGTFTNKVTFSPEGFVEADVISYFTIAEGQSRRGKIKGEDLKNVALEMLREIDEDKPEGLKEDGVAYSPECFRMLVEDDLKGIGSGPCSVQMSKHKNDSYEAHSCINAFSWEYIGRYKHYYCIYTKLDRCVGDVDCYQGVYLIAKEGDCLKKISQLARGSGENSIISGEWEFNPTFFSLEDNRLVYYQNVSTSCCVKQLAEQFQLSIDNSDAENILVNSSVVQHDEWCGAIKIAIELSDDGAVKNKTILGFSPKKIDVSEEIYQVVENASFLPIDQALSYQANVFCDKHTSDNYDDYWHYYIEGDALKQVFVDAVQCTKNKSEINT